MGPCRKTRALENSTGGMRQGEEERDFVHKGWLAKVCELERKDRKKDLCACAGVRVQQEVDKGLTQLQASTEIIWPSFHSQTIIHLKCPL